MKKNVLTTLVFMAAMMGTPLAAKQTAFCPYDGELAQWTGSEKGACPNQVCEYEHFFFDNKTKRSVKHVFWHACDNLPLHPARLSSRVTPAHSAGRPTSSANSWGREVKRGNYR